MSDDPHYIPSAERAEGEPGEGGCLRAEAEEREAAESAPEILACYREKVREAEEAANPPPDRPWPTQAAANLMALGKWPPIPNRARLRAHFDQQLRREKWIGFGFSEEQGRRVRVRSPWRDVLVDDGKGGLSDRSHRTYSEVLFYRADTQPTTAGKTGTAGRPSSWHLVETECRRRYNSGERHTRKAGESPADWADVLLPWLRVNHPSEPPLKLKTATNNLSTLLRELKKTEPEIGA